MHLQLESGRPACVQAPAQQDGRFLSIYAITVGGGDGAVAYDRCERPQ